MTTTDDPYALLGPFDPDKPDRNAAEVAYDLELDEPATPGPTVLVDEVATEPTRLPILPAGWQDSASIRASVRHHAELAAHRAGYHSWRLPLVYLPQAGWYSIIGLGKLIGRSVRWWWHPELSEALQIGVATSDLDGALRAEARLSAKRLWRGIVVGTGAVAGGTSAAAVLASPGWAQALIAAGAVPLLARYGRPADKRIIGTAVVVPRHRRLNSDIVLRAYYAAKLGHPDKEGQQIEFLSQMSIDPNRTGSQVVVALPYGTTFSDAMGKREEIASGLDVALSQVYLSRDPSSNRSHTLWVAHEDPLAKPAGKTPLLRCKPTDIWRPAPIGLDERGNRVSLDMLWNSIMIGAIPRQGKTFFARLLGLYAALDPYTELYVFDPSGKPDWRKFALVAHRFGFGLTMTRDGDPVEIFLETLRELKAEIQERYERLSKLPVDICPEGKLTRELARDLARVGMRVKVIILDEFQEWFDLGEASKEIASHLVYLGKVAPASGCVMIDATQRPSGVGSKAVAPQFLSFRDNHQIRFSLRTGSWQVSDLVLGAGAYSEGYDSSTLLPTYKGVGILRGASDETPTVRTYLADADDAEKILLYAREQRERLGLLTGMAAGEAVARQIRDVLADVMAVFGASEAWMSWQTLAARLAERMPEHYADITKDAISAQVRDLQVPSKDGWEGGRTLKGLRREHVLQAMSKRATGGSE